MLGTNIAAINCPGAYGIKNPNIPKNLLEKMDHNVQELVMAKAKLDSTFASLNKPKKLSQEKLESKKAKYMERYKVFIDKACSVNNENINSVLKEH
mgnify:CR=1 FL=1